MKKQLLIIFASLLIVLGIPTIVWFATASQNRSAVHLNNAAQTTASPALKSLSWLPSKMTNGLEMVVTSGQVQKHNAALERKVTRLEAENRVLLEQVGRYERLQGANRLAQATNWQSVAAQVLARDGNGWARSLVIDRGYKHGLAVGDPVLHNKGLAGVVRSVGRWTSTVQLLNAPQSAVGVLVLPTRAHGVVVGIGNSESLELLIENPDSVLEPGQRIVTSGLANSLYPLGLPLGVVTRLRKNEFGQTTAEITPVVNFDRIEEVLVLHTKRLNVPAAQEASETENNQLQKISKTNRSQGSLLGGLTTATLDRYPASETPTTQGRESGL